MEGIHTLHEFMLSTKNVVYILVAGILIGYAVFWRFLCERDTD
jgi:hypothetical protein